MIKFVISITKTTKLNFVKKIKISSKQIKAKVEQLGRELSEEYKQENPIFIGVLNGSFMFLSDLIRALSIDCEISFIECKRNKSAVESIPPDADIIILSFFFKYLREKSSFLNRLVK